MQIRGQQTATGQSVRPLHRVDLYMMPKHQRVRDAGLYCVSWIISLYKKVCESFCYISASHIRDTWVICGIVSMREYRDSEWHSSEKNAFKRRARVVALLSLSDKADTPESRRHSSIPLQQVQIPSSFYSLTSLLLPLHVCSTSTIAICSGRNLLASFVS